MMFQVSFSHTTDPILVGVAYAAVNIYGTYQNLKQKKMCSGSRNLLSRDWPLRRWKWLAAAAPPRRVTSRPTRERACRGLPTPVVPTGDAMTLPLLATCNRIVDQSTYYWNDRVFPELNLSYENLRNSWLLKAEIVTATFRVLKIGGGPKFLYYRNKMT